MRTGRVTVRANHMSGVKSLTREKHQTDRYDDLWSRTIRSCVTKPSARETRKSGLVFICITMCHYSMMSTWSTLTFSDMLCAGAGSWRFVSWCYCIQEIWANAH